MCIFPLASALHHVQDKYLGEKFIIITIDKISQVKQCVSIVEKEGKNG